MRSLLVLVLFHLGIALLAGTCQMSTQSSKGVPAQRAHEKTVKVVAHPVPPDCASLDLRFPDGSVIDLTGIWSGNDQGLYYMRQIGNCLWWVGLNRDPGLRFGLAFSNVFKGRISSGFDIVGDWADVPRGEPLGSGTLSLHILALESGGRNSIDITKQNESGDRFGGSHWIPSREILPYSGGCNRADLDCVFDSVKKNGGNSLFYDLKPYKDNVVVYGTIGPPPENSYTPTNNVNLCSFFSVSDTTDADVNFDLAFDYLTHTAGSNYSNTDGWIRPKQEIDAKLNYQVDVEHKFFPSLHSELIMFGRPTNPDACDLVDLPLLPGWMETGANSVLVNGRPINGQLTPLAAAPTIIGRPMANTELRVTGALVLDCGHSPWWPFQRNPCDEEEADVKNVEIHPVYAIDSIQDWHLPRPSANLTGAWGGSDAGTYYVRQVDNAVWWLALSSDEGLTLVNVFRGTIQGNILSGDWVDVPLGRYLNSGKVTVHGEFCRDGGCDANGPLTQANALETVSTSNAIFGGFTWEKLYDTPAPQRSVTVTFLSLRFSDTNTPDRQARVRVSFNVNNQIIGFPAVAGTRDVPLNSPITLPNNLVFALFPTIYDRMRLSVHAQDQNKDPCIAGPHMPCPPMPRFTTSYDAANNFGNGTHTETSSNDEGETFQVTYRIDVR